MDSSNDEIPEFELEFSHPPEGVEPRKLKLSDFPDLGDIPYIEMEITSEPITVETRTLTHPWTFVLSHWEHGYMFGDIWITDTRTRRSRVCTDLVIAIRHRERHNLRLACRRVFKDWYCFVEGSSCRMFSWANLKRMTKTFMKNHKYLIKKYRKYGLDGDGPV